MGSETMKELARLRASGRIKELEERVRVADRELTECRDARYALHDHVERLEAALQWTKEVQLKPDSDGNVRITMTLEEFQRMRAALEGKE